jgi:hypothetical protein
MVYEHKSAYLRFQVGAIGQSQNRMTEAMDKASQEGWEVHQVSQTVWVFGVAVLIVFRRALT